MILGIFREIAKRLGVLKLLGNFFASLRLKKIELFGKLFVFFLCSSMFFAHRSYRYVYISSNYRDKKVKSQ